MEIIDYKLPEDWKLERRVIAELIANPDLIPTAMGILSPSTFNHDKCKEAYQSLVKMYEEREQIDIVTMSSKIERNFFINDILSQDSYSNDSMIRAHCAALRVVSRKRRLYYACLEGLQMSSSSEDNEERLISFPSKIAEEMEKDTPKNDTQKLSDAIMNYGKTLESGVIKRVPCGFPSVDRLTRGGFAPGNLVILAARPSVGKTAIMLQMARASARSGVPSLALSLEMTNDELAERMMFSTDRIEPADISQSGINWQKFESAAREFDNSPIYLDETPQTLDEVCATITLNANMGRCGIAYIDYLQLMSSSENDDSLYRQVTGMTKRLKKLAKKLKIPIVLLAQLNRKNVTEKRAPQLHDLRDSGSIEQDADIVIMLDRSDESEMGWYTILNMYIRKNRGGLAGDISIKLRSEKNYTNFYEVADR